MLCLTERQSQIVAKRTIFDEKKLFSVLEEILDSPEEYSNLTMEVLDCINSEYKSYFESFSPPFLPIALRKVLDLQLSRHEYTDINSFERLKILLIEYLHQFNKVELLSPRELQNFDDRRVYTLQNRTDPLNTCVLYRAVSLAEYIEIFVRRELPCNGNYFSPGSPYRINRDGTENVTEIGSKYKILLKMTLRKSLKDLLVDHVIIQEGGVPNNILPMGVSTQTYSDRCEVQYGLKCEGQVISFRMGNSRSTGRCYLVDIQNKLEKIEIEKVVGISRQDINTNLQGTEDLSLYDFRFSELDDYYKLLKCKITLSRWELGELAAPNTNSKIDLLQ